MRGVTVTPEASGERLLIRISYQVRTTNNVFNLVYPFHRDRGAMIDLCASATPPSPAPCPAATPSGRQAPPGPQSVAPESVPPYLALARRTADRVIAAGRLRPMDAEPLLDVLGSAHAQPVVAAQRGGRRKAKGTGGKA